MHFPGLFEIYLFWISYSNRFVVSLFPLMKLLNYNNKKITLNSTYEEV